MVATRKQIFDEINKLVETKTPKIICIDGPAGAGKTTLAGQLLRDFLDVNVVHMDDFYSGWNSPINAELSNRIINQVLNPHLENKQIQFRKYNWEKGEFDQAETLNPKKILVLEGVGAGKRDIRTYADLLIFVDIEPAKGIERVLARDGEKIAEQMENWKEIQANYFESENTKRAADSIIDGSSY